MALLPAALVWLRRDLRLADNAALHAALTASARVFCAFVFDREILDPLPSRHDRRVEFIRESLVELNSTLAANGSGLIVRHGWAREEIPRLALELRVAAVFVNRDYEPAAIARDRAVARALAEHGIDFRTRKDHVIFEQEEVQNGKGKVFTVFTAYKRAWLKRLVPFFHQAYPVEKHLRSLAPLQGGAVPDLAALGFQKTNFGQLGVPGGEAGARAMLEAFVARIDRYHELRDFPAVRGTSYLSLHLRFGTVSIRRLVAVAASRDSPGAQAWLNELVWRDFYFTILHAFPQVVEHAFRPELDAIGFPNDAKRFAAWCEGRTGYPFVDAAMRQLVANGFMSNRARMVTASFLVKDLHVDWRWGERFFARHLNDYDLAANNGNWQWAASTGCDAQPYFRIFNPVTQSQRFDARGAYIRKYVPELARLPAEHVHAPWLAPEPVLEHAGVILDQTYPRPIVDHAQARTVALALYNQAAKPPPGKRASGASKRA
jgi:deoxyribodipyrimidine photo-lyase